MNTFLGKRRFVAPTLGLLTLLSLISAPQSASASSTISCSGFVACSKANLGNFGFSDVYTQSFWGATPGHNCTNYVAYRLSSHGRLVDLPRKLGNASDWGINADADGIPVVSKPAVGDIAWWSYLKGNSTKSHVAYVERVNSDGSIFVSEDNLGGDFDWRTVRSGASWPSGFIRFPQSNGSPHGKAVNAVVEGDKVTVNGFNDEADSVDRASTITISWGGAKGAPGTITTVSSKPLRGNFYFYRTFAKGKVPKVAYIYAANTPGTAGADAFYGKVAVPGGTVADSTPADPTVAPPPADPPPTVSPPPADPPPAVNYATKVTYKFADKTIRKTKNAYATVTLAKTSSEQSYPTGVTQVKEGNKVLVSYKMVAKDKGVRKLKLPKLKKGKHKIHIHYKGTTGSKSASSAKVTLSVRN